MNKSKFLKRILITIFILFVGMIINSSKSQASSSDLYLKNLNIDSTINSDGSMNVVETWNIKIEDTNTIFKTFKTDTSKYSGITDVEVKEVNGTKETSFSKVNTYMYHVTKNCYYGLKNSSGDFEIAWGVSLDNSSATKTYKISYRVEDAIAKYNDYAELYWQFLGSEFEIPAKKISGTITLPGNADSKDNIRVWGHTEDLNGTIYATGLNKIEFSIDNYEGGKYVEVRSLFPTSLITSGERTYNSSILDKAVSEETEWSNAANTKRNQKQFSTMTVVVIELLIIIAILIFSVISLIKFIKDYNEKKQLNTAKFMHKVDYYRELPDKDATPAEGVFMKDQIEIKKLTSEFGKIFSATLLDLSLKKLIEFKVEKQDGLFQSDKITIRIINRNNDNLLEDENKIFNILLETSKGSEELTVQELKKYIQNHPNKMLDIKDDISDEVKQRVTNKKYYDTEKEKESTKYSRKTAIYTVLLFLLIFVIVPIMSAETNLITLRTVITVITGISLCVNIGLIYFITSKINRFTQEGYDKSEEWKGLKKYMEDYSLLNEKEIPDITLWEHFLVYATAFGIADKVIKQFKIVYPNYDDMDMMNNYAMMYLLLNTNFANGFSSSISSSITSSINMTQSSGGGFGGGFSGGGGFGGGGRRWWRQIKIAKTTLQIKNLC